MTSSINTPVKTFIKTVGFLNRSSGISKPFFCQGKAFLAVLNTFGENNVGLVNIITYFSPDHRTGLETFLTDGRRIVKIKSTKHYIYSFACDVIFQYTFKSP